MFLCKKYNVAQEGLTMKVLVTYFLTGIGNPMPIFGNQEITRDNFGISENERFAFTKEELLDFAGVCAEAETHFRHSQDVTVSSENVHILGAIPLAD